MTRPGAVVVAEDRVAEQVAEEQRLRAAEVATAVRGETPKTRTDSWTTMTRTRRETKTTERRETSRGPTTSKPPCELSGGDTGETISSS